MNILQDGFDFLRSQMQTHAGTTITYTRGSDSAELTLTAVEGNTEHVGEVSEGFQTTMRTNDFHVSVDDLVFLSASHKPVRGDTIAYTRDGVTRTFRVTEPMGQSAAKLVDFDRAWRIHTLLVSTA